MDQDDIDLQLAIAAILAHSESIEDKLETKTEEERLKDKNIREEPGLTPEEQKKVEQTTAIVKKSLAKEKKPKAEKKKAEPKPPKEKPAAAKPPAKKVAAKKSVKKPTQPKTSKPPKAAPPPVVAVKPTVVKKKATTKATKPKKTQKKVATEPTKDIAEQAKIFSEVFIKLWKEKVLEPQQETKIKTAAEENIPKTVAPPPPKQPQQDLKKPNKFLDTEGWGSIIKSGVVAGLLAWGFGKEMGEMLTKINENIGDFKQQQQNTFTTSNTIQRRRMRELAVKPNLTIEELEKERAFQLKELQRDKEFREKFKRNESWWIPASLDADTQAVEGLDKQIKKRIESLERFDTTINQLRKDYEQTLAKKEHRKPRNLKEAPKLKPLDLSKEYTDILKRFKMPSILHDYIIKDGHIQPFDKSDNILSIKEKGPFDNLFELTKKVYDTSIKQPNTTITVEPTPIDLSSLAKHFQQQSTYLKQMVELADKNSRILQTIATKPQSNGNVVQNTIKHGNISGSIARGDDSRSLYKNSAYSINVPAV